MSEKQMGFCVDCAAAKPMRSASSSLKLVTCTRPHCQVSAMDLPICLASIQGT